MLRAARSLPVHHVQYAYSLSDANSAMAFSLIVGRLSCMSERCACMQVRDSITTEHEQRLIAANSPAVLVKPSRDAVKVHPSVSGSTTRHQLACLSCVAMPLADVAERAECHFEASTVSRAGSQSTAGQA